MRRLAIVLALCGLFCSPAKAAPPMDRVARRVQHYDNQYGPPRQQPSRAMSARYREEVVPEPVAESPTDGQDWGGDPQFGGGGHWDEYGPEEYYDDCSSCNSWCCGRGLWGRAEYLQWWIRGSSTPPLITTSPDGTLAGSAGILPGAEILAGGDRLNGDGRSGGRFTVGYWVGNCDTLSIENTFFFLGDVSTSNHFTSDEGSPILARPFFNTQTGAQDALLIGFPDISVGSIGYSSRSQTLGNEINVRRALFIDCFSRVDVLAGYRFFYLHEDLQVFSDTTSLEQQGTTPVGTTFGVLDDFTTRNQFHGAQMGLNSRFSNGCWSLDLLAKVALGGVTQRVNVQGNTIVTVPGAAPVNNSGGILALNSNIGRYSRTQFGALPEFGVNAGYQFNCNWRCSVGYTFMILTNVVRPGDQMDVRLDPRQFPPATAAGSSPTFAFHDSDVWLQGINLGLECNF